MWIVTISAILLGGFILSALLDKGDDTSQPDDSNVVSINRWKV